MGILANSVSVTMSSSTADDVSSGYVTGERITLTTSPTGTNYVWSHGTPSASARARSALSDTTGASVDFFPDAGGTYTVQCDVDGTVYLLRLTVQDASVSENVEALRLSPRGDTTVPAPALGFALYYSADQATLVVKAPNGDILPVLLGSPI